MTATSNARTPETLRTEAAEFFRHVTEVPNLMGLTAEDAETQGSLALKVVEFALALAAEDVMDLSEWFKAQGCTDTQKALVIRAMPYLQGSLRLLDMEFVHPACGKLPIDTVRTLIETREPVMHQGVELTMDTVCVQYRRIAL